MAEDCELVSESTPATRVLVCKGCKFGCVLTVELDQEGNIAELSGYTCDRGIEYAHKVIDEEQSSTASESTGELPSNPVENEHSRASNEENGKATAGVESIGYREFRRRHQHKRTNKGSSV